MAQIITDDFNRANSGTLGANWTTPSGLNAWTVSSNQGKSANHLDGFISSITVYTGAGWTGGNDQYTEVAVQTGTGSGNDYGPGVRGASAAETLYFVDCNGPGDHALGASGMTFQIMKAVAGTYTAIGSAPTDTLTAGDIVRCEAQGTTIRAVLRGSTISTTTDSAIASGKPAIFAYTGNGTSTDVIFDNLAAGDFSTGGVVPKLTLLGVANLILTAFPLIGLLAIRTRKEWHPR